MSQIRSLKARAVLDSRGTPTVEVDLSLDEGKVRAMVPSGASTGKYEAHELRDKERPYLGKGVSKAVNNINSIATKIIGREPDLKVIDQLMIDLDGTPNKHKLGANAILAVSIAVCKAGAVSKRIPLFRHIQELFGGNSILPVPYMNIINGGKHAGNKLDIQEFMIVPRADNFTESIRIGCETYHTLKNIIIKKYGPSAINVGDEGGFAPPLANLDEPIDLILRAIEELGYQKKINIALDCAASEFFRQGKYNFHGRLIDTAELSKIYSDLCSRYPIVSIEDPFDENDFDGFAKFNKEGKCQVVGDDLVVTNVERIKLAVQKKACNALLLKINQIGTITEAFDAAKLARDNNWNVMVSHRSGETEDSFIADLAVGIGAGQIKAGAPCRSERLAKYNQLLRIEEELGDKVRFGL